MLELNHISYHAEAFVKQCLSALPKEANIHYFCYGINYSNGAGFTLHSCAKYYESWFENQFIFKGFYLNDGWYLTDTIIPSNELEVANSLGLGNILTYINHEDLKTEIYEFGTSPNNKKIINFYLNNRPLLKKFMINFRREASSYISVANQQLIMPPLNMRQSILSKNYVKRDCQKLNLSHLPYPFNILSKREYECYKLMLLGYANVEIAQRLGISRKSIHVYFSRMKEKLQCSNRPQLVQIARDLYLTNYI